MIYLLLVKDNFKRDDEKIRERESDNNKTNNKTNAIRKEVGVKQNELALVKMVIAQAHAIEQR